MKLLLVGLLLVPTLVVAQTSPSSAEASLTRREFETRMLELGKLIEQRNQMNDRAVAAALASINERLDAMNEFRGSLKDQAQTFLTKSEYDSRHEAATERIRMLEDAANRSLGASRQNQLLIGLVGFLLLITQFAMRMIDRKSMNGGRHSRSADRQGGP